jgi:hypothetical protein
MKIDQEKNYAHKIDFSFESFHDELMVFLAYRFGSIPYAIKICEETKKRVEENDILSIVGNPRIYLSSLALSIGIQIIEDDLKKVATRSILLR